MPRAALSSGDWTALVHISGIGSFGGFQFQLQDLGRNTLQDLDSVAHKIVGGSLTPKT